MVVDAQARAQITRLQRLLFWTQCVGLFNALVTLFVMLVVFLKVT
jgi:hypothetical protein